MYLEVLNSENKILRKIEANVFDIENIRHDLIHQLVLWQQAKKRSPISHTKEISEVKGSTRKIYRQKGTGPSWVTGRQRAHRTWLCSIRRKMWVGT